MKTISLFVSALVIIIITTSCVPVIRYGPVGGQVNNSRPQYQNNSRRHLDSVSVNKTRTGYCEAQIIQGPDNTPANVQRVADYASQFYMRTGRVPSESELTSRFGFKTRARWIDTPDKIVQTVQVRPDEVPANILDRFQ